MALSAALEPADGEDLCAGSGEDEEEEEEEKVVVDASRLRADELEQDDSWMAPAHEDTLLQAMARSRSPKVCGVWMVVLCVAVVCGV